MCSGETQRYIKNHSAYLAELHIKHTNKLYYYHYNFCELYGSHSCFHFVHMAVLIRTCTGNESQQVVCKGA